MSTAQDARHLAISALATQLFRGAVAAAGQSEMNSRQWHFYHGVEASAVHVMHPEITAVRDGTAWLDAEDPSFREGFLKASALLATASAMADPPVRVPMPEPSSASPK